MNCEAQQKASSHLHIHCRAQLKVENFFFRPAEAQLSLCPIYPNPIGSFTDEIECLSTHTYCVIHDPT